MINTKDLIKKQSVQVVLLNDKMEVLSVSRKYDHNNFGLPGGKREKTDHFLEDAIIRETKEETGLDIFDLQLIYVSFRNTYMGYTYIANWKGKIQTDEPHVVKWLPFQSIIDGSFGEWNKQVLRTLNNAGIFPLIHKLPKKDIIFGIKEDGDYLQAVFENRKFFEKNSHRDERFFGDSYQHLMKVAENNNMIIDEIHSGECNIYDNEIHIKDKSQIKSVLTRAGFNYDINLNKFLNRK